MRGVDEPVPPVVPHHRQTSHMNSVSTSRARVEAGDKNMSGVALPQRHQKHESTRNHKKAQHNSSEVAESQVASESVVAELQHALTEREKDLEEEQTECSLLRCANSKATETIRNQVQTIAQLDSDADRLSSLLDSIVEEYLSPYARENGTYPNHWDRNSLIEVLKALSKDARDAHVHAAEAISYADEVSSLSDQVRVLQKEMLAKMEKVRVASDEEFAHGFRVMVSVIKTMSRTVRIDETVDVAETLGTGPLLEGVSASHWAGRAKKKLLVEAWIWSVLLIKGFRTPFAIFGGQCEVLNDYWHTIYRPDHCNGWPKPTVLCEAWRYTTVESLLERIDRDVIALGKEADTSNKLEIDVSALHKETFNTISSRLAKVSSITIDAPQVQNIVGKAFKFALQMSLQRVRIQVTHPKVGDTFSMDAMKAVPNTDGEDADDGTVAFTIHPGLTKWGDTYGKNLDHSYDILPSLVQLTDTPKPEYVRTMPGPRV